MIENYCALYLAIVKHYTPEQAFEALDRGKPKKQRLDPGITQEMINFRKEGMTYRQIGEMYGLGPHAVYKRLKRANA